MKQHSSRLLLLALCTICVLAAAAPARATLMSFSPTPADLNDLDHHLVYSWRIDNINLNNISVTGATLTFKNIANWDSNTNMLFVWLLDTAASGGVASVQDVDPNQVPVTSIVDAFLSPISLVSAGTAKTKLFQQSFGTTGADFTYTFTAAQLQALTNYINNGNNVAFGFDPDCHFFNDGVIFTMNVVPIPEVANILPIAGLLIGVAALEIRRRRRVSA